VAALCLVLGVGCSKPGSDDAPKLKAEVDSLRAELGKAQEECAAVRADLERLRAEVRARPAAPAVRDKASLPGRLAAAKALTSPHQRQEALARLAVDAAELGDAEIARGCIDQITSPARKQEVVYKSALGLAKANKAEDAVALAGTLTSPAQRQQALSRIANGDYQD
jgi:hypothetical protein